MRKIEAACLLFSCLFIALIVQNRIDYKQDYDTSIHAVVTNFNELKIKENNKGFLNPNTIIKYESTPEYKSNTYTEQDLYLYANVVDAEAGSSWLCDEHQQLVVCVLKNRINSNQFPNTLYDVIYQKKPIQYESAWNGSLNKTPSDRAIKNVKTVLNGEYTCPNGIVFQSEHIQGKIYKQFYNKYTGTTTYFCYNNEA